MTKFRWTPSVACPGNYPMEFRHCYIGFGTKGDSYPLLGGSVESSIGICGGGGYDLNAFDIEQGLPVPNSIDILWVSYIEQKFYKANIKFPEELQNKMLNLFREGYYSADDKQRISYNNLVVTLLPGGKIWLYLDGFHRYVCLDYTLQAEETQMLLSDFVETRHGTLKTFCEGRLEDYPSAVKNFAKHGIPEDLWEVYGERFPYDLQIEFENEATVIDPDYGYYFANGEMFGNLDSVAIHDYARIRSLFMVWNVADTVYTGHFYFNEDEVIQGFREAFGSKPNAHVRGEFVIRVSKYNNWFDIFLRVGNKEYKFEKTQIHVFKQGVDQPDKDAVVFYNNHRDIHSRDIKFIGQ